jgi:hypothetical protein
MEPTRGRVAAIMEVGLSRGLTFGDSLEVSAMSYIDNCRAHALHCLRRAYERAER